MASKAVGEPFGVSKNAALIIVRNPKSVPSPQEQQAGIQPGPRLRIIVDALYLVLNDIKAKNNGLSSVISLSYSISFKGALQASSVVNTLPSPGHSLFHFYDILQKITQQGSSIVVSGGNYGDPKNKKNEGADSDIIRHAPAIWNHELPLIVVGNVGTQGARASMSP